MAARRSLLISAFSLSFGMALPPAAVRAEDLSSASSDVETGKHQFLGEINANGVYVRSGPRDDAYPTAKLDKGARVTVVGMKFNNWLKILPPEGSFAYVPQVHVQRRGDGSVGRASRDLIAYAGSELNPMKIAPMAKVGEGEDVKILGVEDEYFKIKPPEGSYLYVHKQFVNPVQVLPNPGESLPTPPSQEQQQQEGPIVRRTAPQDPSRRHNASETAGSDQGLPTTRGGEQVAEGAPASQPAESPSIAAFEKLEGEFTAANDKPITEQPLAELLTGYQGLAKDETLPSSMRRIADLRISTLKVRSEARDEFLAVRDAQAKMREHQKSLVAEREEIEERIKQNDITFFTVVGTLRTSSIQRGSETLYRLTDPSTEHTVAYLRSNDPKYASLLGQFIGVRGTLSTDSALNMKVLEQPTDAQAVDKSRVNSSVAAQLVPPSLMPRPAQASTVTPQ